MDIKKQILTALGIEKTNLEWQAKLTDGTIVVSSAPELEAGVDIAIMTEDGTTMPLPVGSYETEDGVGFTVEEDGVVASLLTEEEEAPSEAPEEEVEAADEESPAEEADWAKSYEELKDRVQNLEDAVADLKAGTGEETEEVEAEATPKTIKKTEVTEFDALEAENKKLKAELKELNKSAATDKLNFNKFSSNGRSDKLSKADYNNLTSKEKFAYNLTN